MKTNIYYSNRNRIIVFMVFMILYVFIISYTFFILKNVVYIPNNNKSTITNKVISLSNSIDLGKDTKIYLSDIEYNIDDLEEAKKILEQKELEYQKELDESIENIINANSIDSLINEDEKIYATDFNSNSTSISVGELQIPTIPDTSFKGYMCIHTITSKSSKQYQFIHSGEFKFSTDEHGILTYNNYYVVAMGSYYTNYKIGSTFRITLDSGKVFDVIVGDAKADIHTDELNMYRPKGLNRGEIVEFLVACGSTGKVCNNYHTMTASERALGNLSSLGFQGNIVKIEKLDDNSVVNLLYN